MNCNHDPLEISPTQIKRASNRHYLVAVEEQRLMEHIGTYHATDYPSWEGATMSPFMRGGNGVGYSIWQAKSVIPYLLLLSGALPSELA